MSAEGRNKSKKFVDWKSAYEKLKKEVQIKDDELAVLRNKSAEQEKDIASLKMIAVDKETKKDKGSFYKVALIIILTAYSIIATIL